jgi:ankyrin repeat protein
MSLLHLILSQPRDVLRGAADDAILEAILGGADLNERDMAGNTPLLTALALGLEGVASLLISEGADIHTADANGHGALYFASMTGSLAVVRELLRRGADVQRAGSRGHTPLFAACSQAHTYERHNLRVYKQLEGGAQVEITDPAERAAIAGPDRYADFPPLVEALLRAGANPNALAEHRQSALFPAAQHGQERLVELLVTHGSNPNLQDEAQLTALHYASRLGDGGVAQRLLVHGADPHLADGYGITPLHEAVINLVPEDAEDPHIVVVDYLLQFGADPRRALTAPIEGYLAGQTPMDIASARGGTYCVDLMRDALAQAPKR